MSIDTSFSFENISGEKMTSNAQGQVITPSNVNRGNISSLWKYPDIAFLVAVIGILFGVWFSKGVQDWRQKRLKFLKLASMLSGPPALPLIGNALRFACHPDEILDRIVDMYQSYGTQFRFWLGPKLMVVLTDPRDIEVILNSPKAAYKDPVYRFLEKFIGRGLITGSGPKHRTHRRVIMPMLNGKVLDAYVEYFDRRSRYSADRLEELADTEEFDIYPYMEHCTIDIILDTIMGTTGSAHQEGHQQLAESAKRMYELVHSRIMKLWLHPDWIFARTKYSEQQTTAMKVIHGFTESLIAQKKKEHQASEKGSFVEGKPRVILLEQLLAHIDKTNVMDDVELRDEIYTIFIAAQDTTATISSFAFLMLGMHPEIQDKVRTELHEVLGERNVTSEKLPELKYLEMVIKETLRLFPIAPLMVRELKDDVDLETCTLPEGCSVVMVPYLTHRDPNYWVNPDKFEPHRFAPENSIDRHSYAYVPFSSGLRGCIGQKYAMMCLKTIVANVVRRYRVTCKSSLDKLRLKTDISIRSVDGYKISITRV